MTRKQRYPFTAGIWEQSLGFFAWSRHRTQRAAIRQAVRYARAQNAQTGGALSWAGGWAGNDEIVHWVDRDGAPVDE